MTKLLWGCQIVRTSTRKISKYVDKDRTGKAIRQKFLDYFINKNNHNFIKSSPVVPFCDPTVAFVNAGMNQFKGVFLGTHQPQYKNVANSQKCIRVGGKHNDLNVVGGDGYHHTFFEMLGNWSFGDYFKQEACELAWKLLTEEYKIHPSRLYVTYFKGDPVLGIDEDLETKEIWKTIGVSEDRILPFTSKDNFWEMGPTGPCGPCTEIHIDHTTSNNRAKLVNKGLHDLTELWNLVFIQYNRKSNESVDLLPEKHVDTGMGFERLTAVLQGKISNYDTDNFTYLLKAIHKNCSKIPEYRGTFGEKDWNSLDASYRVLADHARMVTVCLADAMIPEQNQKLRRVMRRAFLLCENVFNKDSGLLKELSNYVIEHLGCVYPEMERNVKQIHQIIDYEEEVYKSVRKQATEEWVKLAKHQPKLLSLDINENPSLVAGYKEISSTNPKFIDAQLAFKLYDTFGLDEDSISSLAQILNLPFNASDLHKQLELAKIRSKEQGLVSGPNVYEQLTRAKVPKTDRSTLYNYAKKGEKYVFDDLEVVILKIVKDSKLVRQIESENFYGLVLDKSSFYTEAGGQISDRGAINFGDCVFEVTEAQDCNGYILHKGFLRSGESGRVKVGMTGSLKIDPDFRLKNMRNHTAVHLLNSVLKKVKGATCQKSSKVTQNYFNLDVGIFAEKLSLDELELVESTITKVIQGRLPVNISELDSQRLANLDEIILIPGEVYPETGIRVVEVKGGEGFLSREPCCGTHVLNTSDIEDFCIVSMKSLGRSTTSIHGVTGDRAKVAKSNGTHLLTNLETLEKSVSDNIDKPDVLNMAITSFKKQLNYSVEDENILPVVVKQQCADILNKISKQIKDSGKRNLREFIEIEMRNAMESNVSQTAKNRKYMVHYLRTSLILENVSLQKATNLCPDIPVLIISYSDNVVKARCCVPENMKNVSFDAEKWMKETVAAVFKCSLVPPKGYDPSLVCNMKAKRVKLEDWDPLLQESLELAKKFAEQNL
ncbi:alanine--tRNA ligase, mitochondrial [Tribolium castaneum]|uniref:alanine--tRNA ligase, mitochondrial n=1 Tax=Tribolium castaneum TaxID=7070 RepID=UPI00046C1948|nr:PREDICTED: alanine--tRNA ligase, mitochondrial [Tribolium castaneum]|eukprot:XP_008196000.1 PREDICTED: alanine--tRNA ligase, mitochondrial [Tribolium castaneum]